MVLCGSEIHHEAEEQFDHNCDDVVVTLGGTSRRVASPGLASAERLVDPTGPIQVPLKRAANRRCGVICLLPRRSGRVNAGLKIAVSPYSPRKEMP